MPETAKGSESRAQIPILKNCTRRPRGQRGTPSPSTDALAGRAALTLSPFPQVPSMYGPALPCPEKSCILAMVYHITMTWSCKYSCRQRYLPRHDNRGELFRISRGSRGQGRPAGHARQGQNGCKARAQAVQGGPWESVFKSTS